MPSRTLYLLLAFSVALNVSFAGTFLYYLRVGKTPGTAPGARGEMELGGMDVEELDRLYLQSLRETLDLSEEQVEAISPLVHQVHIELHGIANQLNEVGERLYREATGPRVNGAALDEVHARWLELRNRQHRVLLNGFVRMREVLTPEQQERYFSHLRTFFAKGG